MNIKLLLTIFIFPLFIFGQSQNIEIKKIDSIIKNINNTDKNFAEGIIEGPKIYGGVFKKNGGWEAYYLYDIQNKNIPIRIRYNLALRKSHRSYEF